MFRKSIFASVLLVISFGIVGVTAQQPQPNSMLAAEPVKVPKTVEGGVLNDRAKELPIPEYPENARSRGIGGKVAVSVTIDETGNVISAQAEVQELKLSDRPESERHDEEPLTLSLKNAAESAARMATFAPTLLSGVPVKVTGTIIYRFDAETGKVVSAPREASGGVLNGRAVSLPTPTYPSAAKAVRAEGTVTVKVQIGPEGNVIYASAISGHPLLRAASEAAAREAKFLPTLLEGKPVTVAGVLTYQFVAPKKDDQ